MASISNQPNGRKVVQFIGADGKRRSIRLGEASDKHAEKFRDHVEELARAISIGESPCVATAAWRQALNGEMYDRLVAVGLATAKVTAEKPKGVTLGEFLTRYIDVNKKGV